MKHPVPIFLLPACILLFLACGSVPGVETPSAALFEPITISGTHEIHSDLQAGEAFTFNSDKIDMVVTFTATSQADNTLKGTAQVTYNETYEFSYIEDGYEPCNQAWTTEPITWTADLTGRMQENTDGSLTVVLIANPKNGPSFTQNFNCEGEKTKTPEFAFIGGVLTDGKYNNNFQYMLHPMLTGSSSETTSMELIP